MTIRTEFEQKLHDEQLAMRRRVTAPERVDLRARLRILAWLLDAYAPAEETES